MKKLIFLLAAAIAVSSCGIYSFSGTSIQPDVKTISIPFVSYKAQRANPTLANDLTEAMRTKFRRLTRLEQVDEDGDMEITATVTGYDVRASSVTANDVAAQNRLTITVQVSFVDNKHPEENFDKKAFSGYADYDSTNSLDAVESSLCTEIIDKIVEDIFNATVAQW